MSDVIIAGRNFANVGGGIDKGIIVMWSGTVDKIPEGWQLCDGTNDTPDLRDRFIVGAGNSYSVGDTGGADTVTLTVNHIPSHNHETSIAKGSVVAGAGASSTSALRYTSNSTTGNTGGGAAHENRPPYYALCFIIKL